MTRPNVPQDAAARLAEIQRQIADLKARMPAHSVPPALVIELEELEEEEERLRIMAELESE